MKEFICNNSIKIGLLLFFVVAWGCAANQQVEQGIESGKQEIFRHRWWNYYARALSAAEQSNHSQAIADLQIALSKRERDQRMARTYGMHFVDYFPHRELGILFWETDRLASAQKHLETSIAQTPTAKTWYYLDRVRKERIRQKMERETVPAQPPAIRLDPDESFLHTRDDPVVISGSATDPNFVESVTVHGKAVFIEGARQEVAFRKGLELSQGIHQIAVKAASLSGLSTLKSITVHVDRQGPLVEVHAVERSRQDPLNQWEIVGRAIDPSSVASLHVNQAPVSIPFGTDVPFRMVVDERLTTANVVALDRLGNENAFSVDLEDIATGGLHSFPILLASREPSIRLGSLFQKGDLHPPTIQLKGWTASQTVYMDKVVIEGSVRDNRQIKDILINDKRVTDTPLTGFFTAFSCSIGLDEGKNVIAVKATDTTGNQVIEEITIIRRQPEAMLLDERLSVSVLPFGQHGDVTPTSDAFQDVFMQQLAQRDRFKLVDRNLLDVILQEHKINRTDLVKPETALHTGRLTAAHAFIGGSIIDTRMGVEVISRLVDTETAEVLIIVDAFIETEALEAIRETAEQISLKLHREFPLVEGDILSCEKQYVVTDLGSEQLKSQRRILILQKKPVLHPITRHPLGNDYRVLGFARLVQIHNNFSKAKIYQEGDQRFDASLKVITQ